MSRAVSALDRVATFVVGLVLVAAGLLLIGWVTGVGTDWLGSPSRLSTTRATDVTDQTWWPWVAGIGGVILGLLVLRWLAGHLPVRRRHEVRLEGSRPGGRLSCDLRTVADAAATQLQQSCDIRRVRASVRNDRGTRTLDVVATCDHGADLTRVRAQAERMCADLVTVLGDAVPATRVRLHTTRRPKPTRRVR